MRENGRRRGSERPARGRVRGGRRLLGGLLRRAAFGAALVLAGLIAAAPAAPRELHTRNFHAELVVMPDSSLDVTETITAQFVGAWNGIYRTIPVEYAGPGGFNYSLFVNDVAASEGGTPLRIERSRQGPNLQFKIYVPGANDATRTISLHYHVANGLRYFDDHDELYWNVTGNDWTVPIEAASAHIVLPVGVTGLRAANYTGVYGSRAQDAEVEPLGSNVDVRTTRPLEFREGLTVVAGWDKGFVRVPSSGEKFAQFMASNWALGAPVVAFLVMFWLWFTRGRDPRVGSIAVQYEPPAGLTPGEAGTLVDDSADLKDITATIVDLAVRGYLTIEERKTPHMMGLYSDTDYVFHRTKPPTEWKGTKPHELLLLAGMFMIGALPDVALSDLQNKFYRNLPGIRDAMFDSLVDRGYYLHRPDKVRQSFIGGGIIAGVLLFAAGQYFAQRLGIEEQPFVIAAILTAAVICIWGLFMRAHTASGVRAREDVLGFEDFLGHVEADRMERIPQTPETFEKFLPYAMALGVEKKWAGAFQSIMKEPPSWYQVPVGVPFYPMGFANSLGMMSMRAGQVMASAPRSSSGGSGFGGGGGSGGGFGGGGGGGF
jgi:hypothetical protein